VKEYNVEEPTSVGSGMGTSAGEAEAIAEISAMKSELERLMDENKSLREKSASTPKTVAATPLNDGETVRKADFDKLQAERQRLAQQLKEAQLQLATPVVSTPAPEGNSESSEAVEQLEADKKKLVAQLKEMQQQLQKANATVAEAKAAAAKASAAAAAAAAASALVETAASPPPAPTPQVTTGDSEALQKLQMQVCCESSLGLGMWMLWLDKCYCVISWWIAKRSVKPSPSRSVRGFLPPSVHTGS